jgi:hypothetical protein
MLEVARMLKRRSENIITYLGHRITNAASESINAKIQWIKYTSRGYRADLALSGVLSDLQPHHLENFKLPKKPQFAEKVRDIAWL